ncbi:MAG TPA: hypothetical protein VLJ10_00560, partial [Candidatus Bathyarchaeia archaeon]|nr:hypothetical protein [Candidatus Bathyarchaeia archaeon]
VLNARRAHGETKVFTCSVNDAYDTVLELTRPFGEKEYANLSEVEAAEKSKKEKPPFVLFQQNAQRRWMVVMGVPQAVDTTEVGIFFDSMSEEQTKIVVVSLSSRAQATAAAIIFERVASRFGPMVEGR